MLKVEILACSHCDKHALCVGGTRITTHKCAGQWTTLDTVTIDSRGLADLAEAMRDVHENPRHAAVENFIAGIPTDEHPLG